MLLNTGKLLNADVISRAPPVNGCFAPLFSEYPPGGGAGNDGQSLPRLRWLPSWFTTTQPEPTGSAAHSAALLRAQTVVFRPFPAPNILHADCDGKPLQRTSTGTTQVFQPLPVQVSVNSWYLAFFSYQAPSPTAQQTPQVSSNRYAKS